MIMLFQHLCLSQMILHVIIASVENKVYLDEKIQPEFHPSTNIQYGFEKQSALYGILEMEFGFRKSFPVVVAELCHELVPSHGIQRKSALWIGAGSGRGPFILSRTYEQVNTGR